MPSSAVALTAKRGTRPRAPGNIAKHDAMQSCAGQVEDAPGAQFPPFHLRKPHQCALCRDRDPALDHGRVTPAEQYRLPSSKPPGISEADPQRRQSRKPALDRQQMPDSGAGCVETLLQGFQGNRAALVKRADGGSPQWGDMSITSQLASHVARQCTNVRAFAARGREIGVIGIWRCRPFERMDFDCASFELDHFAFASEIIGALAVDFHGREARRHLFDQSSEARQESSYMLLRWPFGGSCNNAAFGVIRVAFFAPADSEAVDLSPFHDERNGLGCLAERNRQDSGRQWIKGAGVTGAFGVEGSLDHPDGMRGGHPNRFVEDEPAMHVPSFAPALRLLA